jgi:hypothetical protein
MSILIVRHPVRQPSGVQGEVEKRALDDSRGKQALFQREVDTCTLLCLGAIRSGVFF